MASTENPLQIFPKGLKFVRIPWLESWHLAQPLSCTMPLLASLQTCFQVYLALVSSFSRDVIIHETCIRSIYVALHHLNKAGSLLLKKTGYPCPQVIPYEHCIVPFAKCSMRGPIWPPSERVSLLISSIWNDGTYTFLLGKIIKEAGCVCLKA